ncbi:MAG: hypothetical protein ISR58_14765 [Anaerolineales bacterium]|nr:hypothetical protein [FCB group bacterium]MBL6982440.1 hypothetical protein [Anaerolineales bacterium]
MKFSTRNLVTLAVFGTLWGISEITLGTLLKTLDIPLSGLLLSIIGLTIALIGRIFVPMKGSTIFIGAIAMLLKLFSLGGVVLGPMLGIFGEAIIAEILLSLTGKPRLGSLILAGGLSTLWVLAQPFVTNPILYGRSVLIVWEKVINNGGKLLGLGTNVAFWIMGILALIHLASGAVVGILSWTLGGALQKRVGISAEG